MFHVSPKLIKETMYPRIPNNWMVNSEYENDSIPRICFSNCINGCLIALGQCIQNQVAYVYRPTRNYKLITNAEIIKNKYVYDAEYTKELWIIEPCEVELMGIIQILDVKEVIKVNYKNKVIDKYRWNWRWVYK